MAITHHGMTLAEFLELPEEKPRLEYFEGRIQRKPYKMTPHGRLQYKVAELINHFAEPRRLAMAFTETRGVFANAALVPDVGVVRWEHLPLDANGRLSGYVQAPWDIAIEVRSPSQSRAKLLRRCRWFVEQGVGIVPLIEPIPEVVTVFRPSQPEQALRGDDPIDLSAALPGFDLTPAKLLGTLYPSRRE